MNLVVVRRRALSGLSGLMLALEPCRAASNVMLTEVPDYNWHAGCFGTATGNLMGYWDRHGFPNFYTGPTAGGVAPLDSYGAHQGIRAMWASRAGLDGRPADQFGHMDDYWLFYIDEGASSFASTAPDPYLVAGRPEHSPDCIGDFIGLSQNKWTNLNGECDGNIDGYAFVFWNTNGERRINFVPPAQDGRAVPDLPSGLKAWAEYRGSGAEVFSQLTDFNSTVPNGQGFTFQDMKAEIDAGYPVLLFMQRYEELYRGLPGMARANPNVHAMLAYGYYISDDGSSYVRYMTSWASGGNVFSHWDGRSWQIELPIRGVVGFHPLPQITNVTMTKGSVSIQWNGPSSVLFNAVTETSIPVHRYLVEKATRLDSPDFEPISEAVAAREVTVTNCCDGAVFFRVRLLPPPPVD